MKRLPALALALALALSSACGSSPMKPTSDPPLPYLAGAWSGVMTYTQLVNGIPASRAENVTFDLTQSGGLVSGSWATSIRSGNVNGNATTAAFSGTFTYSAPSSNGNACIGTLSVSGGIGGPAMTWTSSAVIENCFGPPENIMFALHR